ncbi:topoisomerase I binding, arginine/serine-rich a [Diretmus argenteus]
MSATKVARQRQKSARSKTSETMSAEVSPDSKCPICLDLFNNMSYLDICLHKFCFRCIHEWSKNKAECPLCKQPFNSIYHSIKSEQDFKKYDLQPLDNGSFGSFGGVRFRYRTTLTGVRRQAQRRTSPPPDNGVLFEGSTNPPQQQQDRGLRRMMIRLAARKRAASEGRVMHSVREDEMINFRRELYRRGAMVRSVRDGGRSRDTTAEFYKRNPACLHRLVPWLKRELMVLYGAHGSLVNIVQHIIMSRITRYDMEDGAIHDELRPFLQGRTEHFLHEFISFAKSPFNMEAYDQHAVYDCPAPSSNEDNSSNSSVIAISEDEQNSFELDPPGDSTSSLSQSVWDDETPGPSYSTTTEQSRTQRLSVPDSDSDSSGEDETQECVASPQHSSHHNQTESSQGKIKNDECLSSGDDDCVIVGFVKPAAERTPELVQLSSNTEESDHDEPKEVSQLPKHIRFTGLSPGSSGRSRSSKGKSGASTSITHKPSSKSERKNKDSKKGTGARSRERQRSRSRDRRRRRSKSADRRRSRSPVISLTNGSVRPRGSRHSCSSSRDRSHIHSSSCSPLTSHEKPGGKRKYKTRHLEDSAKKTLSKSYPEPDSSTSVTKDKKKSKEKHRKKSKEKSSKRSRSLSVETVFDGSSCERSKRHHKKKKKHKKKSKRHKSKERTGKHSPTVITIDSDSDNLANDIQASSTNKDNTITDNPADSTLPESLLQGVGVDKDVSKLGSPPAAGNVEQNYVSGDECNQPLEDAVDTHISMNATISYCDSS